MIVSHIGCREHGLLPDGLLAFVTEYNKASEDYHKSMNSEVFLEWMRDIVMPRIRELAPRSVIVVDQARYHRTLTEETRPRWRTMNKPQLVEFLISHGWDAQELPPHRVVTVVELKELARLVAASKKFELVSLANEFDLKILYLPVGHPELNPIEKDLGCCEEYCVTPQRLCHISGLPAGMTELRNHMEAAFEKCGPGLWTKFEDEVIAIENDYLAIADMEVVVDAESEEDEDIDGLN